jgi:hypothetical protein
MENSKSMLIKEGIGAKPADLFQLSQNTSQEDLVKNEIPF